MRFCIELYLWAAFSGVLSYELLEGEYAKENAPETSRSIAALLCGVF